MNKDTTKQEQQKNSQRASLKAFDLSTSPKKVQAPSLKNKFNKACGKELKAQSAIFRMQQQKNFNISKFTKFQGRGYSSYQAFELTRP